ncbi:MAG: helix-turn-helix domain-containing protein [Propionibacteriaceae bacterium]|nr:helix-turn-helix domain-containing protein [Propionibacteriaceae bacterium]
MPDKPPVGTGRALVPSKRARAAMVRRLAGAAGAMTTAITQAMDARMPWFGKLSAEERSWITLVARAGIDGFAGWFGDDTDPAVDPLAIFSVAPRAMTRRISLQQTVDIIRTSIEVVEEQIATSMPKSDRLPLQTAIVQYSREVAFAAAEVYAQAAESIGAWDERTESIIIDAVVRHDDAVSVESRAATLGWPTTAPVVVIVGETPGGPADQAADELRHAATRGGLSVLCAAQGDRLIALLTGAGIVDDASALAAATQLQDRFGPGAVIVSSLAPNLGGAFDSAAEALSGAAAAPGWPEGPRVRAAKTMLPERALLGHPQAREDLLRTIYHPLVSAGGDLLSTCVCFLDHAGSIEASARALFVHANTVRYRIKRIDEVTGASPTDARDAYALRVAITLGRLAA